MRKAHYLARYVNSGEEEGAREKKSLLHRRGRGARKKKRVYDGPFLKPDFEYLILKTGLKNRL